MIKKNVIKDQTQKFKKYIESFKIKILQILKFK